MSWIKVRNNLISHPKLVRMSCAMCAHPVRVLGALVLTWSVADQHADGEFLPGMTIQALDSMVDLSGFGTNLVEIGWLKVLDDGLQLVNYQEHNGDNAKRRAENAKRMQLVRKSLHALRTGEHEIRTPAHLERDNKSKNKKKKKKEEAEPPTPDQIEFQFPCDGEPDHWPLTKPLVARWSELYPKLDILSECRKALAWVESNPENRKTAGGMTRFLNGWLARSSDRSPARSENRAGSGQFQPRSTSSTRPMSERVAEIRAKRAQAGQEITLNAYPLQSSIRVHPDALPLGVTNE